MRRYRALRTLNSKRAAATTASTSDLRAFQDLCAATRRRGLDRGIE
jgi:hypothetical protein